MNDKQAKSLHEQFTKAVSELQMKDNSGTNITISYKYRPVEGRRAKRLWDFAMAVGYESALEAEPKFNYDRLYCFIIEQQGEVSKVIPMRTQAMMFDADIKRWKVRNGKKRCK